MILQLARPERVFDGDVERGFGATEIGMSPSGEPILIDRTDELLPPAQRTTRRAGTITLNVPVPMGGGAIPPATAPTRQQPARAAEPEQDAPDLSLGRKPELMAAPPDRRNALIMLALIAFAAIYLLYGDDE